LASQAPLEPAALRAASPRTWRKLQWLTRKPLAEASRMGLLQLVEPTWSIDHPGGAVGVEAHRRVAVNDVAQVGDDQVAGPPTLPSKVT